MSRGLAVTLLLCSMFVLYSILFSALFNSNEFKGLIDQLNSLPKVEQQ